MNTAVITGSSSGIGFATAKGLLSQSNRIVMICREGAKSRSAQELLIESTGCSKESVDLIFADLGSRDEIQSAIEEITNRYDQIDVLINNAAVLRTKRHETTDGLEMNFAVNYLAIVQLTSGLLPLLKKAPEARVINVGSEIYKQAKIDVGDLQWQTKYKSSIAYANSKLMGLYYTVRASQRFSHEGISFNNVHPGVASTDVSREYPKIVNRILSLFLESSIAAARPVINLATSPELKGVTGSYFNKDKKIEPLFKNDEWTTQADEIWRETQRLLEGYSCLPE